MANNNSESGNVEILQEEVDEDYEPTDKEIREYAEWLGIDAEADPDLLWIARRGLMTPLPKPWRPCQSGEAEIFYFNPETGENTWDHPCDAALRELYAAERAKKASSASGSQQTENGTTPGTDPAAPEAVGSTASSPPLPETPQPPQPPQPPAPAVAELQEEAAKATGTAVPETPAPSVDDGKLRAPLGLLGPLPPLAPPNASNAATPREAIANEQGCQSDGSAADGMAPPLAPPQTVGDLDDLFDLPLELGNSGPDPTGPAPVEAARRPKDPKPRCPLPLAPPSARAPAAPHSPGGTASSGGDPPSPIMSTNGNCGDLSPIAASEESPSPRKAAADQGNVCSDGSPVATSKVSLSSCPPAPPVPPSLVELAPAPTASASSSSASNVEDSHCCHADNKTSVTARLCRELEQARAEAASEAAAHKASQAREQALSSKALSNVSQELASEAAECRRWREERSAREETVESIRAETAARLAAQAQAVVDLQAELTEARAEISRTRQADAATKSKRPQIPRETSPPQPAPSAEHDDKNQLLASDAPSPPTPELVSILVAELRPSDNSGAGNAAPSQVPEVVASHAGDDDNPQHAASPSVGGQEQPSLWSQLEEDGSPSGVSATPKGKPPRVSPAAAASSSLELSSLSAVGLECSLEELFECGQASPPKPKTGVEVLPARDAIRQSELCPVDTTAHAPQQSSCAVSRPPQEWGSVEQSHAEALAAKVKQLEAPAVCTSEELRSLRAELGELRAELREQREASAHASPAAMTTAWQPNRRVAEAEADIASLETTGVEGGFQGVLDPSSRCPTLRLQGRWNGVNFETLGESALQHGAAARAALGPSLQGAAEAGRSTGSEPAFPPVGADAETVTTAQSEHLRLHLQAIASSARTRATAPEPVEEPVVENVPPSVGSTGDDDVPVQAMRAAHDRSMRAQRDARDACHRLEGAESELERLSWEMQQWREDANDSERILRDTRAALHKEQASHVAAKAAVREGQREVRQMTSQVKTLQAEAELAAAEVQRMRSELADEEAEKQRLQLSLQARDAEVRQLQGRQKAREQLGEAQLRTQRFALTEREELLGGRERVINEREQLATEAEEVLRQQRGQLRSEIQRVELANIRNTASELAAPIVTLPLAATKRRMIAPDGASFDDAIEGGKQTRSTSVPILSSAKNGRSTGNCGRRGSSRAAVVPVGALADAVGPLVSSDDSFLPKRIHRALDGEKLDLEGASSSATSPIGPPLLTDGDFAEAAIGTSAGQHQLSTAKKSEFLDACRVAAKSPRVGDRGAHRSDEAPNAVRAAAAAAAGELPDFLRNWRKELRREHAALEDDRRAWRSEARRAKQQADLAATSAGQPVDIAEREILTEVRTALDARAAVLNASIGEYRGLERLHSAAPRRRGGSTNGTRAHSMGSLGSRHSARKPVDVQTLTTLSPLDGQDCSVGLAPVGKGGHQEQDLLRRWQRMLGSQQGVVSNQTIPVASLNREGPYPRRPSPCRPASSVASRAVPLDSPCDGACPLRAGAGGA